MRNRDWSETAFMVFICLMMVIGGLSEGYPGLALFGGFMLALFVVGFVAQIVMPSGPKVSSLPRPVLILLMIPVGAIALYMYSAGDGEMRTWAVLLMAGWAGLIVASFIPEGTKTIEIKLPGIRIEGDRAEEIARAMGVELPDAAGMKPGETRETNVVKRIEIHPGDLANVEETIARMVLGPQAMTTVAAAAGKSAEASLERARSLLMSGGTAEALAELDAIARSGTMPEGTRELRGIALVESGKYEEALSHLGTIGAFPRAAEAWFAKGEACRRLGQEEEARVAYEQAAAYALTEEPGGPVSSPAVLPLALERLGNTDGATKALEGRLAADPEDGSLLCVRALLSAKAGATADALTTLEGAIESDQHQVMLTLDDPAFAGLASDPRVQALRERAERERGQQLARLTAAR